MGGRVFFPIGSTFRRRTGAGGSNCDNRVRLGLIRDKELARFSTGTRRQVDALR